MAEISGTFNISGGQQNFGGDGVRMSQTNVYAAQPREELTRLLADLRQHLSAFPDPAAASQQIVVVERALARPEPADEPTVRGALETLAGQVNAGTALADAIAKAVNLVVQHWPF